MSVLNRIGGPGSNSQVQENIARTQLRAVNHAGTRLAEARARSKRLNEERVEQLKAFSIGDPVTNGQKTGRVVRFEYDPAVLVVKITTRLRSIEERWAPDPQFVSKVPAI